MPYLGAYALGGLETTNPLITRREYTPLHHWQCWGLLPKYFLAFLTQIFVPLAPKSSMFAQIFFVPPPQNMATWKSLGGGGRGRRNLTCPCKYRPLNTRKFCTLEILIDRMSGRKLLEVADMICIPFTNRWCPSSGGRPGGANTGWYVTSQQIRPCLT